MLYVLPFVESEALANVESKYQYVVFSAVEGVISQHRTATEASQAFAAHVVKYGSGAGSAILKREEKEWKVF